MADPRISNLLDSWLGKCVSPLAENAWVMDLIERVDSVVVPEGWHERMMSHRIRRALTHGDFAVWNLRITREGVTAIDWEWAEENGIAGIDLAHGLRQECYMVHRMKPAKAVAWMLSQADLLPWKSYLNACGWGSDTKDWLRLGLLHSHFNAKNDSAELLEVLGIHLNS
jgi:thiamine kinase-like enzyme